MSIIYLENQYQISTEAIAQVDRIEEIPFFDKIDESLRVALTFTWQWLRGDTEFEQTTSGSTGTPKIINIRRRQMIASAHMTIKALGLDRSDLALLCISAQYIGGKMMIVRSLLIGMDIVMVRPTADPLPYVPFLPTFTAMVPLQMQTLLNEGKAAELNQMKAIIIGGAAVSMELEKQISRNLTIPVYSTYGMTETVSHIALRKLTPPGASPFFKVTGNNEVALDDRGCLKIKGEVTDKQWVITNDLAEIQNKLKFRWLGRFDSVINSGGVKIVPEQLEKELEPILRRENFLGRFIVTSRPDSKLGEQVILLIEGSPLKLKSEEKILKAAVQELPPYQAPKAIYYLSKFAETLSGKVQRSQSRKILLED